MDARIDSDTAGFTLFELLVVVAVLAVLAVGASLAATRSGGEGASDADRFRHSHDMARALAVQGQERRGLEISRSGIRMAKQVGGIWQAEGRKIVWRDRVVFAPQGEDLSPDVPEILFLPDGRSSAFSIRFAGVGCRSDGWTGLKCDKD